jgi:predicted RNA-binding Zn-ribbon protein involved in translation (DUF1610 family)
MQDLDVKDVKFEGNCIVVTMRMQINDWLQMIKPKMPVICKKCGTTKVYRNGLTKKLKQKYKCMNDECDVVTFNE